MKKLLLILLLVCLPVSSATHYSWNEWIKETVFNDKEITGDSQFIHIEAPYRAINGGNVPIKIYTDSPGIVKFTLIIDENPTPCCAIFEFDNIPAYVETNIRVNAYTYLRVVAEDIYGNLYMNTEFIKAAGGCSAPSMFVSDKPLGSIELVKKNGEYNKYQFWHPNYSGLQFNQLTRTEIPADYIDNVVIKTKNGMFEYNGTIGISQNHYFTIYGGEIKNILYTDNLGNTYEEKYE